MPWSNTWTGWRRSPLGKERKDMSNREQYAPGAASGRSVQWTHRRPPSHEVRPLAAIERRVRKAVPRGDLSMPRPKRMVIDSWIFTALFCLQIGFTAYAQLRLPQVAEAFTHLGFPAYFRVELSWAKLLGVVLLLAPVPARLKEWAYAGFAITLGSALIAHLSVGDGPEAWGWAAATGVLWGLSYFFWRRVQATPASA